MITPYWTSKDGRHVVYHGDCLDVLAQLGKDSADAIITDPPYFKVKNEAWDRQWDDAAKFIEWIGENCKQWQRVLKANGSLYCFASPKMAARVECEIGESFAVLENVTWVKPDPSCELNKGAGRSGQSCKEALRSFFPRTEEIIFAEHYGADSIAKGEAGYVAKCDELRGFVFEPVMRYIIREFEASQLSRREVDEHFQTANVSQYWLQPRGFIIPTADKWNGLRQIRPQHFRREYEDLRREYEDLRREYEDLRRPFTVTADVPYTDVWTFPTVQAYAGKHPCEKPLALMEHIVKASTRTNAVVLDSCAGSGSTMIAAHRTGRQSISIELSREWCDKIVSRYERETERITQMSLLEAV